MIGKHQNEQRSVFTNLWSAVAERSGDTAFGLLRRWGAKRTKSCHPERSGGGQAGGVESKDLILSRCVETRRWREIGLQKYEVLRLRALPPLFRQGAPLRMTAFLVPTASLRALPKRCRRYALPPHSIGCAANHLAFGVGRWALGVGRWAPRSGPSFAHQPTI
jgi:hypothetical protein